MSALRVASHMSPLRSVAPGDSLATAQAIMDEADVAHLPVIDQGKLVGVLSLHDLLDRCWEDADHRIGDNFPLAPLTVTPDDDLMRAADLVRCHHVSCLVVVAGGKAVGLLTIGTLVRVALNRACDGLRARDLMTPSPLVTVRVHARLLEAKRMMRRAQICHLPVTEGALAGILSDRDLLAVCRTSLEPPDEILAGEVMSPRPFVAHPDLSGVLLGTALLREAAGAIPVVSAGELLGIVTRSDFVGRLCWFEASRASGEAPFVLDAVVG